MRKFSIKIWRKLSVYYNHHLSDKFIKKEAYYDYFEWLYPLWYSSRGFDKPAIKWRDGTCIWCLDDNAHRIGKPAKIYSDGVVDYFENGIRVR